jgi:hypothetical protein
MTDYYSIAETGLLTLLKTELSSYFPHGTPHGTKHVTASDDTILSNGNDNYAISYPGNFPVISTASSFRIYNWEILLDIMVRWKKDTASAWAELKDLRQAIIALINHTEKGRTLGKVNYVREAVIAAEERPRYIPVRGSDPNNPIISHIGQICIVTVTMNVPRT